jgi:hypothetical protein
VLAEVLQQLGLQQHVLFQRRAQLLPRARRLVQQLSLQRLLPRLSLQPLCQQPLYPLGFSAEAFPQAQNALPRLFLPQLFGRLGVLQLWLFQPQQHCQRLFVQLQQRYSHA